jgi:hypothetical protein
VDKELESSTFIWYPESNYLHMTFDLFKTKRPREDDDEEDDDNIEVKPKHNVIFKGGWVTKPSIVCA